MSALQNQNARTHGLTAQTLLNPDELATYDAVTKRWTDELGACCEAERSLIHNAAIAAVRIERCQKAEAAAVTLAKRTALQKLQAKRRHVVRKLAQSLQPSPASTYKALKSTPEGIEWLIDRFHELDSRLAHGLNLTEVQYKYLLNLSGHIGQAPGPTADPSLIMLWWLIICHVRPEPTLDLRTRLQDEMKRLGHTLYRDLPGPDEALLHLRTHISDEIQTLQTHLDQLNASQDDLRELEESAIEITAQVPITPASQLRHRYEQDAHRNHRQNISLLLRIRQDRRRADHQAHHASGTRTPFTSDPAFSLQEISPNEPSPNPDPVAVNPSLEEPLQSVATSELGPVSERTVPIYRPWTVASPGATIVPQPSPDLELDQETAIPALSHGPVPSIHAS